MTLHMVSSTEHIHVIAEKLCSYGAKHIVVDLVMVATSGARLLDPNAVTALETELLPLAEVITPNIPEAEILCGHAITSPAEMEQAPREISAAFGCNVLCKGGHDLNDANDLLYLTDGTARWFNGRRMRTLTPTAPAARCPAPLRRISRRAMTLTRRWSAQRRTSPARWPLCLTSATAPAR